MEPFLTTISTNIKSILDRQSLLLLSMLILLLTGILFFYHLTPYIDAIGFGVFGPTILITLFNFALLGMTSG